MILLPVLLWYILFQYVPMAGLQLAFKDYKVNLGIWEARGQALSTLTGSFQTQDFQLCSPYLKN